MRTTKRSESACLSLNVMQASRAASRPLVSSGDSTYEQTSVPFEYVVSGSQALKITVK